MQRNKQDKDRGVIHIDVVEKSLRPSRLPPAGRKSEQNRGDSQAATATLRPIFNKKRASEDLSIKPVIQKKKPRLQTTSSTSPKSTFEHMKHWLTQASEGELSNLTNYLLNRKPKPSSPICRTPQETIPSNPKVVIEIPGRNVAEVESMLPRKEHRCGKLTDRWDVVPKDQYRRTIRVNGGQRQLHRTTTVRTTGGSLCDAIYEKAHSRSVITISVNNYISPRLVHFF